MDVSVVIPLYNKAPYVRAALESVLAQSQPAKTVLVVDDGSSDDGPAIVEVFNSRGVRLVRQANAGPGAARNRGIEEANQPWIAFLDADDLWLPDHLAHLAELHRAFPDTAVLATGYKEFRGYGPQDAKAPSGGDARRVDYLALDPEQPGLSSSSIAIKCDALRAAGGFGATFPGEDVDLWIRLGLDHPVVLSPKVTALYRRGDEGLTHDYLSTAEPEKLPIFATLDAALADPRYQARHPLLSRYRDRWLLLLARQALGRGDPRSARSYLADVAKIDRRWGFLAALAALPAGLLRRAMNTRRALKSFPVEKRRTA